MKKNILNRIIISVLSLSLVFSFPAFVSGASHAANGANVIPSNFKWTSFSVRDDIHTKVNTEWEESLCETMNEALLKKFAKSNFFKGDKGNYYESVKSFKYGAYDVISDHQTTAIKAAEDDYKAGKLTEAQYTKLKQETGRKTEGSDEPAGILDWQSWTHGSLTEENDYQNVMLDCRKSNSGSIGGDGQYSSLSKDGDKVLVGDNPWGLTLTMDKIPVEFGRYYTMEFDISSTLKDKNYQSIDKHFIVKAYDYQSNGGPAAAFESVTVDGTAASKNGTYVIKAGKESHIKATFKIPSTKSEWSGGKNKEPYTFMGIMFAFGAFDKTYQKESWSVGKINVNNMKVTAGTQYAVKYFDSDGKTLKAQKYVNEYEQAPYVALKKKGKTLDGYINMANGAKFNFGSLIEKDTNLKAKWIKTPKPKKASFKLKSKKKKKVTVTFKKNKNAKGYQVKYSYSKKFKKKAKYKTKTKNTSKTKTYTIKSLKSSKILYVKARAYNKDSCGNKVYGKWGKRKKVYVK